MASLERYRALSSDFDLGLELISAARLRTQCPWLGPRAVGGSLCLEDGQANPRLVSPAFALAAQRAGAQVLRAAQGRGGGARRRAVHGAQRQCAGHARSASAPCCSTARAPGPAPSPRSSARPCRCARAARDGGDRAGAALHGLEPGRGRRRHLLPAGGARQPRARRRHGHRARCRPRARRPRRHRHARGAGRRAAAHAAPCAHHPHLERHRGLPARPRTGARPQPHHARPVPRLRLRGRGLPDRPRPPARCWPNWRATGAADTPIDAFAIERFDQHSTKNASTFRFPPPQSPP
jgi:sarcosine oxidase subunit beta